jgi:hypothetical protein
MRIYPVPNVHWSLVAVYLFELYGISYLVLVDSYSGYTEPERLHDTTAARVWSRQPKEIYHDMESWKP